MRAYLERGAPAQDNKFFRNRLEAFLTKNHYKDYAEIASYLKQEAGLVVETSYTQGLGVYYDFPKFFTGTRMEYVLSVITLIYRFLYNKYPVVKNNPRGGYYYERPQADAWRTFVERALREERAKGPRAPALRRRARSVRGCVQAFRCAAR